MKLSILAQNTSPVILSEYHYKKVIFRNHIYVAGKISGLEEWEDYFVKAENFIRSFGGFPLSPRILPPHMSQQAYMDICFSLVRNCNAVLFLKNWKDSLGAVAEHAYAVKIERTVLYEE